MRKGKLLSSLLLVLSFAWFLSCETNGPDDYKNYFVKYYGGDGHQEAKDFVVNDDGSIIMLGTSIDGDDITRLYLVKTDIEGNVIWQRKIGSTAERAQDIELITSGPDAGKVILLSNIKKNSADSTAIRLTVVNQDGDSLKSKLFNQLESQRASSVTALTGGGYYVVGNTTDTDAALNTDLPFGVTDIEDELVIKFEADWNTSTFYQIGRSSIGSGIKVFQVGSEFYYAGYWDAIELPTGANESNFFFRRFLDNPNSVSTLYVGDKIDDEFLTGIAKGFAGSYLAVGTKVTTSKSIVAAKINSSFSSAGSVQTILQNAESVSITSSISGGYLIVGNQIGVGNVRDIVLVYVDADGIVDTSKGQSSKEKFGASNNDDVASNVYELQNGDILILGTMELVNQKKMALIKIKANGSF
ncbi:MAG: hypothetical protein U0U09_04170 [Cyclobacteriaceae bacterium]